ncbi:MAG TPA: hypothetical protein VGG16_17110 [Streptosporangiaceae bacterium]
MPEYPVGALTSYELRDYRAALEKAVAAFADGSPGRQLAQERLRAVIAEQDSRPVYCAAAGWEAG